MRTTTQINGAKIEKTVPLLQTTLRNFSNEEEQNEMELIKKSAEGDTKSFNVLAKSHQPKLYGTIYNMVRNHEDTEDLIQIVMAKCYKSLARFKGECSFATYIHTIAYNTTINHIRKKRARFMISIDDVDNHLDQDQTYLEKTKTNGCDAELLTKELGEKLKEAIARLPLKHQQVVQWFDIEGQSHREIAKRLGLNENTVRSRLFYAHQTLQGMLAEYKELL